MNENQASKTAEYMALFRALESARPAGKRLFDDPFAQEFLRPGLKRVAAAAHWPLVNAAIARLIDTRWPGARTSGIARTCFIDGEVHAALARGIEQVVILGAGYDCRAYRLSGIDRVRVYEVDHPATQRSKQACLVHRLGALPDHVKFVDVDFNSQRFDSRLAQANLSSSLSTLWIWEGVTNYLTAAAVAETFDSIRQLTPRSRVVFTYVHSDVLSEASTFPGIAALRRTLSQAGEAWTFGFDPAELPPYLAAHGFQWREDLRSVEYRRRYLPAAPRLLRGYEFYRLAVADAV